MMSTLPKLRILVADDNPLSLCFLAAALTGLGHEVISAEDGMDAVNRAGVEACDVLLLDARMPRLGGAEALALVRMSPGLSQYAVALATTADNGHAAHSALLAAGFAAVLTKPASIEALRSLLALHVPAQAHGDETLDDAQALAATGGDARIVDALRGMFADELALLPTELALIGDHQDAKALRDRLHRLDASAGLCGAPGVTHAAAQLRAALDGPWPPAAIAQFLATCERVRERLVGP